MLRGNPPARVVVRGPERGEVDRPGGERRDPVELREIVGGQARRLLAGHVQGILRSEVPALRPGRREFGREMLRLDLEAYRTTPVNEGPVFFDRSVLDALAFAFEQGDADEGFVRTTVEEFRYHPVVFVCPPWEAIYCRDAERDQDFSEATAVFGVVTRWYRRFGYEPALVPRVSVEARADFMLTRARRELADPRDDEASTA